MSDGRANCSDGEAAAGARCFSARAGSPATEGMPRRGVCGRPGEASLPSRRGPKHRATLVAVSLAMVGALRLTTAAAAAQTKLFPEADQLREAAAGLGKPEWRPMLRYVAELHVRSTHPAMAPFAFPWEEIGPGYTPAFGHWDVVHEILDTLPFAPRHAREELLNDVRLQLPDGFLPGSVWMPGSYHAKLHGNKPSFNTSSQGHPPVWVVAAEDYMAQTGDRTELRE